MKTFHEWLEEHDPQLAEGVFKRMLGTLGAVGMAGAGMLGGGAIGGALGGIPGALAGGVAGKKAGEYLTPEDWKMHAGAEYNMKKRMRKRMKRR